MNKLVCSMVAGFALSACQRAAMPDPKPAASVAPAPEPAAAEGPASDVAFSQPPANAVQREMRLLTAALEGAVRAIGLGDVTGIRRELHRVHEAKSATEAALADGSYRPPRNPDQLETFRAMDEAFHERLRPLLAASRENDVNAAAQAIAPILQSCQGCHSTFRAPPAPSR